MKTTLIASFASSVLLFACSQPQQQASSSAELSTPKKKLFLDVHNIGPGKVTFDMVSEAHKKDLATQGEFDVSFIKYWVDEQAGKVYCLAESPAESNLSKTHEKAHGLIPDKVMEVTSGVESALTGHDLYLDVHELGAGKVTAEAVAGAHQKDLAVQGKYNVNFVNYWVDEKLGTVVCLSEAPDSLSIVNAHTEAHGLVPVSVQRVKQGN